MAPPYEKSVFINCPYDDIYEPLLHAIVLTVAASGFTPRSALETVGQADPRMVRIARGLLQSKYSIHDLSRFQGEGAENLARFNMPLELGMALGLRYMTDGKHNWAALVPVNFVHQKFISDLAGYDSSDHDQQPQTVIKRVSAWLRTQPDFTLPAPTAKAIYEAYGPFCDLLKHEKEEALGVLTWPTIVATANATIANMGD